MNMTVAKFGFWVICWEVALLLVIFAHAMRFKTLKEIHQIVVKEYQPVYWDYMLGVITKEEHSKWFDTAFRSIYE